DVQRASLPLIHSAHILNDNALQVDWEEFTPKDEIDYILGNPPFIGSKFQDVKQRNEIKHIFEGVKACGVLDYVAAWYLKAAQYVKGTKKKVAFVSTNSITMGEQVGILWNELFNNYSIKIYFAHRTFSWSSEARGKAAVHVVIIGFAAFDIDNKFIYEYEDVKGEPHQVKANNINSYLIDSGDAVILSRTNSICEVPKMGIGNKPIDDGNYLFTEKEKKEFVRLEPCAERYFRPFLGAREFLNKRKRWVMWLGETSPTELRKMPNVLKRIEAVKQFRLASKSKPTQAIAKTPTRFHVENMPSSHYLLVPRVSSERRIYIPIGFCGSEIVTSDACLIVPDATLYHFGILTSLMHMAWVKHICGRLKSDFRYSKDIVYNNYPWPKKPSESKVARVEAAAQGVLDERAKHPESSLADMYDPLTMPAGLVKAHNVLDRAVDRCYRGKAFGGEMERLEYLFGLYNEYTAPLIKEEKKKRRRRR
ncbi:MAG: class I SAM-dependent DNA methyltransferase, partial [Planctomycetes bacterium]|nr:class I SAM-dependent DNA methyltransferase [Planctomycetota bacterium]